MRAWRLLVGGPGASREGSWCIGAPEICIQIPKVSQFGTQKGRAPWRRWTTARISTELSSAFFSKDPTFSRLASLRVPGINLARDCICPFDVLRAQKALQNTNFGETVHLHFTATVYKFDEHGDFSWGAQEHHESVRGVLELQKSAFRSPKCPNVAPKKGARLCGGGRSRRLRPNCRRHSTLKTLLSVD